MNTVLRFLFWKAIGIYTHIIISILSILLLGAPPVALFYVAIKILPWLTHSSLYVIIAALILMPIVVFFFLRGWYAVVTLFLGKLESFSTYVDCKI